MRKAFLIFKMSSENQQDRDDIESAVQQIEQREERETAETQSETEDKELSDEKKKRSIKDLTPEELDIYRDGIAAFRDFIEYTEELKKRNHVYEPVQTAIYLCSNHRTMTQKFSHVIEIMCHEGRFDPKLYFDYIIMMRTSKSNDKAIKDTLYDMLYISEIKKDITSKQRREIFHRFVENYREQDRKKKEQVDEATKRANEIKEKNKEIYKSIITSRIEHIRKLAKDGSSQPESV